ncbi:MAG: YgjV family protein [Clostridia bacterium]|nr:YgjV family protein [Clostridia bacterium]MDD7700741.1 YgjV family protein [Eubacteriales bacterium]MDY2827267.1 YgjV family protein [Eubacteriales bacterium]
MEIFISVLSYLALVTAAVSTQMKRMRGVLLFQAVSNISMGVSLLLSDGLTGCFSCLLATVHTLFNYCFRRRGKNIPFFSLFIFCPLYVAAAVFTFAGPISLLPLAGTLLFAAAIFTGVFLYRVLMILNTVLWGVYALLLSNYSALITYAVLLFLLLFSIARSEYQKKKAAPPDETAQTEGDGKNLSDAQK